MKRLWILITLAIVVIGFIISLWLVPGEQEAALIDYKDQRLDSARAVFEAEIQQGKVSPGAANALIDLYLQYGEIDKAIAVMERYVEQNPDDIVAWGELGRLYRDAQRPDDYMRTVERINQLQPNDKRLQELTELYRRTEQFGKQVPAMEHLAEKNLIEDSSHYLNLANMQAGEKKYDSAIKTLEDMRVAFPDKFTYREVEFLVSLQMDAGKSADAHKEASSFIFGKETIPPAQIARLVNIIHYKGAPDKAWDILSRFPKEQIVQYPELFTEYVLLQLVRGEEDEAYALMRERYDEGKLPAALTKDFLYQAAVHGDGEVIYEVAEKLDPTEFNQSELLSVIEVAQIRKDTRLLNILSERMQAVKGNEAYALIPDTLTIARNSGGSDEAVDRIVARNLTVGEGLQIARICYQARRMGCVRDLVADLDNPSELNDSELQNAVELMVASGNFERAQAWIASAEQAGRTSETLEKLRVNIYAAQGDSESLQAWLMNNTPSSERFGTLFFMAYDNGQYDTASMIGENWYANAPTADTRRLLISAHRRAGENGKALALLRDAKDRSQQENDDYLAMLFELSKTDPAYRAELAKQAEAVLRSGSASQARKKSMIYALIDAGRADIAMPYIREFAIRDGGEWAEVYAGYLDKAGKKDEARDFRMQLAQDPSATPQLKRQIAFTLLDQGYTQDALLLFGDLASTAPADSADVKQLFYLWGPRLSPEQLSWVGQRAQAAPTAADAAKWYEYAAAYSSDADLGQFVETYPNSLGSAQISQRYIAYLMSRGDAETAQQLVLAKAQESDNPVFLTTLADTSDDYGLKPLAQSLYMLHMERYGEDAHAVRRIGILSFAQADYTNANRYLSQYIDGVQSGEYAASPDDYMAYYYYAELLRLEQPERAKGFYQLAYDNAVLDGSMEALSVAAQAQMRNGDIAGGSQMFERLLADQPNNRLLRADYTGMLVETQQYEAARQMIDRDIQTRSEVGMAEGEGIPLDARNLQGYYLSEDGQELVLQYQVPEQQSLRLSQSELQRHEWLQYGSEGYDRALLVAKPGYRMTIQPLSSQYVVRAEPAPAAASTNAQEQIDLRYTLLDARIDLETGKEYAAVQKLNAIGGDYPGDAQLLGFSANAQNYAGHWKRALTMLDAAGSITPQNEDIAILRRDIWLLHAPHVKADYDWVEIGDSEYDVFTLSGFVNVTDNLEMGGMVANVDLEAEGVRNAAGVVGNFEEEQQQAEIYAALTQDNGNRAQVSLFANQDTLGLGAYYGFITELGETTLVAEYHRPNWDFVEGILENANRDRLGIEQLKKLSTRLAVGGGLSLNRYNLEDNDDVAQTVGVDGLVVYELQNKGPYLAAAYDLNAEYRTDVEERVAGGTLYHPLPIDSREVHTVSLLGNYDITRQTEADFQLGYSVDRLAGHGPLVAGALTHRMFKDQLEAQVRASYGMRTGDSDGDTKRAGGYLKWRF